MPTDVTALFGPPPDPPTELGRYRVLSGTAGVRVSPLCLGAMSIGDSWESFMGSMSKENSFKLLDAFEAAGGNFIDTANNYQDEQSETWLGEWMASRKNRDRMVIATKFTTQYRSHELGKLKAINYSGNSRKSLHLSLADSLRKLQTDYIDLLYVHWWDYTTNIEELMDSLHVVVQQGKVLYLGVSDTPAWIVSAANTYARAHGKTPFSVYQGEWNVLKRDFEREIIPMAREFKMALCPWNVLVSGRLQSKKNLEDRKKAGESMRNIHGGEGQFDLEKRYSEALEKVAGELGVDSVTAVALAYVMQKTTAVFPIVGGRKVEHLHDNIKALSIHLSDKQVEFLESVEPFDLGFPLGFIGEDNRIRGKPAPLLAAGAPGHPATRKADWARVSLHLKAVAREPQLVGFENSGVERVYKAGQDEV